MKAQAVVGPSKLVRPLLLALLVTGPASAAYLSPQVEDLEALRVESSTPVRVEFRAGFPVGVDFDVARPAGQPPDFVAVARQFLDDYADLYLQDHPDVELVHSRTDATANGRRLVRFGQTWKGFPVFGAELVVTLHQVGVLVHVTRSAGSLLAPARIDRTPVVQLEVDLQPEIAAGAAEEAARATLGEPAPPSAGTSGLVIFAPSIVGRSAEPTLAWRVTFGSVQQVLVDADTGQVVYAHGLHPSGDDETPAEADYDLQLDDAFGNETDSCFYLDSTPQTVGREGWLDPAWSIHPDAVKLYHSAWDTYRTYYEIFGRHSWDDNDAQVEIFFDVVFSKGPNAVSDPWGCLKFSLGFGSLDVLAHEFTHQVNDYSADLIYEDQSGALDEAFADILAMAVDPADWLLAEDRTGYAKPIRNLADPTDAWGDGQPRSTFEGWQPDRMSMYQNMPVDENNDWGGVHSNSGIINKAFYLMAAGGDFNGRHVTAIGRPAMVQLAYHTLTRLFSTARFANARHQALAIAQEWAASGEHSFTASTVCSVREAFRAVEIGQGDVDCDGIEDYSDDGDGDGIYDNEDNCPNTANPSQWDSDLDGDGDECDPDGDNDGIPDWMDPCFGVPNDFDDSDGDGIRDCYEVDDDNDGILDDGDHSGDPDDDRCAGGATVHCDDNCQDDYNPDQADSDGNGRGNVCDPDADGDMWGIETDNCTFVPNPDQVDTDGDGFGDACDECPDTLDTTLAYSKPQFGWPPKPYQPDSDGDGTPDACDPTAWGDLGMLVAGAPVGLFNTFAADGVRREVFLGGMPGNGRSARVPFGACVAGAPPLDPAERIQLVFDGMSDDVAGRVEDENGRVVGLLRHSSVTPPLRGLQFRPRCDRAYSIVLTPRETFNGSETFVAVAERIVAEPGDNPWTSNETLVENRPDPLPDADRDGLADGNDSCPTTFDPRGADWDGDGHGDACDNCRTAYNPDQGIVEFPRITATDKNTMFWGQHHEFMVATGSVPVERGSSYDLRFGADSGFDAFAEPTPGHGYWFLFRHLGGCGTWGDSYFFDDVPLSKVFLLTLSLSAGGKVTRTPPGSACTTFCQPAYDDGTVVTLTAEPDPGLAFVGWGGACSGTGSCVVTMDADKTVTAIFSSETHVLTVTTTGGGTVTSVPAGIACGAVCSAGYGEGTSVALTAAPDAGHVFAGWSGACTGTGSCAVTMDGAKTVTASFTTVLSVAKTGTGTGTVTSSPAGIACGATCSAAYVHGTAVSLAASPDAGSVFAGWGGACGGSGPCVVTMDAAKGVTAIFNRATVALNVAKAGTGGGTVTSTPAGISCGATCSASFQLGTVVTLTAAPDATSTFAGWSGACSGFGSCTVTMDASKSVTASFNRVTHTLTVTKTGTGTGIVTSSPAGIDCGTDCSQSYVVGTVVTLTANGTGRSVFAGWSGACSGTGTCTVTMNGARSVTANFRQI